MSKPPPMPEVHVRVVIVHDFPGLERMANRFIAFVARGANLSVNGVSAVNTRSNATEATDTPRAPPDTAPKGRRGRPRGSKRKQASEELREMILELVATHHCTKAYMDLLAAKGRTHVRDLPADELAGFLAELQATVRTAKK